MIVGFIARGLTKGGVTRYIENILKTFDESFAFENSIVLFTDRDDFRTAYKNIKVVYIKNTNKIVWDYIKILFYLSKIKLDVVFYPKNIIPFTHCIFKFKKVNIIHDLAHFKKDLNAYKRSDTVYMKLLMKLSCFLSDRIVAVSQSTKSDIERILKVSSHKISVIYEAVEDKFKPQSNKFLVQKTILKYNIQEPFIFYCGSLSPRKNLLRTLMAFYEIKDQIPHNVYLACEKSWNTEDIREYIKEKLSERVFFIGYLSEDDLINIYSGADLYLYASLYEGFGLPILEAQACGCPLLTSDKTACPEIAGDGALIVDPLDTDALKSGILEIVNNPKLREKLINKGFLNLNRYSWVKTAQLLLENASNLL